MTKISKSSSLCASAAFVMIGLMGVASAIAAEPPALDIPLEGFGPLATHLEKESLWRGFDDSKSPVLILVRAEKVDATPAQCASMMKALLDLKAGDAWDGSPRIAAWEPWSKDDLKEIADCSKSPCDVKLNIEEGKAMGAVEPGDRFKKYIELVGARVGAYHAGKGRKEFEFPGDPIDPWVALEKLGFRSAVPMPKKQEILTRLLDIGKGKFKILRQVLDRRAGRSGDEATVWIRDVVTNHYFDSWGEWRDVRCDSKHAWITLAMALEFDLLKQNDLISKMGRGSLKRGINGVSQGYLDDLAKKIQLR